MLRPEQMSKVSVTGSKQVLDDVIETVHDLNLLHVTEYDGSWEGFTQGDPIEGAEERSERLVTVRSIESILDVDRDDVDARTQVSDDEEIQRELADVRERVNELDDRREEINAELRDITERIDAVEPFATLGIDLDLLQGYDTLTVRVGEGDPDAVRQAVADTDEISTAEIFAEERIVAVFARPSAATDEDPLNEALVGVEFAALDVPDAAGSPEEYVADLEDRAEQLESTLSTVESELEEVRMDAAEFLLAAEEQLSIDVQKREAPLSFATTENAFIAEGWIPRERFAEFTDEISAAVGDHVSIEEIERAEYTSTGKEHHEAAADGGTVGSDSPPIVQDNAPGTKPFEVLVNAVGRPKYSELDPTLLVFLTFPLFFGFMIGDVGYGIIYVVLGYFLYSNYDSPGFVSMGGVAMWAGAFTILFGILYGEIFGLHVVGEMLFGGSPPLHKGLQPADIYWAQGWLLASVLVGVVHLNIGFIFDFIENFQLHSVKDAVFESGSWILMLNGLWIWVLSAQAAGVAPGFMYEVFSSGEGAAIPVGFTGFSPLIGTVAGAAFVLGLVLLVVGEPIEAVEFLNVLVNGLSYTRIAAVLLAKAGMAFTVNLLFFGAYQHHGEFHFMTGQGPEQVMMEYGAEAILFPGLVHSGVAGVLGGVIILVVGHILVLALGVTSAGLQAVRLEYVEFFGKFYDGGGEEYEPFGYVRRFTTES